MYHIKEWGTGAILSSHKTLSTAKCQAKKLGHTGEDDPWLKNYPPMAYVVDDHNDCVYNPRFSKKGNK